MSEFNEREECPICLEAFTKSTPGILPDCNHRVHRNCTMKWKNGSKCCVCIRSISIKGAARYGRKKKQSVDTTAGTSEEPRSSETTATPGQSKRKEAPELSLRRSTRKRTDTSGERAGLKLGTKSFASNYREEDLKYVPDWEVYPTDHPSDPRVAQNLADGMVLPAMAMELAETPTEFVLTAGIMHSVKALNFFSTARVRASQSAESEEALKSKIVEKDESIIELKKQLEIVEARAAAAESRVEVEAAATLERTRLLARNDASLSELMEENRSNLARAMTAEEALEKLKSEVELKVLEASSKAVEEFKASEQYKNALVEYAFSKFNEIYSTVKKGDMSTAST